MAVKAEGRRCLAPKIKALLILAKAFTMMVDYFQFIVSWHKECHSVGGNHSICFARLCILFIVFTSIYFLIQQHEACKICVISIP